MFVYTRATSTKNHPQMAIAIQIAVTSNICPQHPQIRRVNQDSEKFQIPVRSGRRTKAMVIQQYRWLILPATRRAELFNALDVGIENQL